MSCGLQTLGPRVVVSSFSSVSTLSSLWQLADDEVAAACCWGAAKFPAREGDAKSVAVPVQSSPFVFERLTSAAQSLASAVGGRCLAIQSTSSELH